jgi:prevent-host-death family protein
MATVNIFEAKTQLSKLIAMAEQGQDVIIARAGKPVARLCALQTERSKRIPGSMKGKIWIADDFDAPLPDDLLAAFEADLFPPEVQAKTEADL